MKYKIPFNRPFIAGKELYYIAQSVLSGHTSGNGPFMRKCQRLLEERLGAGDILLTTSCTSALEMAGLLCEMDAGDEVIMPSFTFVSTANAFLIRGIKPVFVDIRRDTKNLDASLIEAAVTPATRAIVPVHYAGVGCEMDEILAIARKHGLRVIEDAAQGVNAKYKNRYLGTIGDFGAYSFHETKNFICGEGGALALNDHDHLARAEILREKGTNRTQFFRGEVDKYTWVDVGSSYIPADLLAAFLYGQLEFLDRITAQRQTIYETYLAELAPLADRGLVELPSIPTHCESNYHMFHILMEDSDRRSELITYLKERGILAVFHYVPLHSSPMGRKLGSADCTLPVTEDISERLLRLPFYFEMTPEEVLTVTRSIFDFFKVEHDGQR